MIYYPIEKFCSRFTDKLITINKEDFELAKNKFKSKEVHYIPGVGVDLSLFEIVKVDKAAKRREIGVPEDALLLLSVGELNENKNHGVIIKALEKINDPNVCYAIAGVGDKREYLLELASKLGVSDRVHLIGYRNDIPELNNAADVFCFPSFREGLPASLMEAMAGGLPCAVSCIRGNSDLIDADGGSLFDPHDAAACCEALGRILRNDRKTLGTYNRTKVQRFSQRSITEMMRAVYDL
jgi:glycosyltransferase involved in cell wall biosynthesis